MLYTLVSRKIFNTDILLILIYLVKIINYSYAAAMNSNTLHSIVKKREDNMY